MNKLSQSSKASMLTRTITAIVLVAVLVPTILFGGWAYFALMIVLALIGIWEILRASGRNKYNLLVYSVVYVFVFSFIFWVFLKNLISDSHYYVDKLYMSDIFVSLIGIILYALTLFTISIISPKVTLNDVTYLFTVGIVFALGFQGMLYLRYFPISNGPSIFSASLGVTKNTSLIVDYRSLHYVTTYGDYFKSFYENANLNQTLASSLLLFFVFVGTWASDVGAYFFGMLFGKHRMNPRVSPHKTWEGFFGGVFFSAVVSLGLAAIFEFCFNMPLVPGLLQFSTSSYLKNIGVLNGVCWPFLVLVALCMPVVGNIGGFLYSLIKRTYGIKDYGNIFPGHGGVIDRFDSVMINSIIIAIILSLTSNGWRFTV